MAAHLHHRLTAVFRDVSDAAAAYRWARQNFDERHVSVLFSEETSEAFHRAVHNTHLETDRRSSAEAETTGAAGVAVGAGLFALAGAALAGVGLVAAGPIAAALAGGTVGAMVGPLVGGLVGYGFPELSARAYEEAIHKGAVAVGVMTPDDRVVSVAADRFRQLHGEQILSL